MATPEANHIRARLFPSRTIPDDSIDDWRQQELKSRAGDVLPAGVSVRTDRIAGLHCEWINEGAGPSLPVILYLHGGGYVLGNCATHRNITARIAASAAARAVVPEYRLAPEHRFPAPVEDAIAAYDALLKMGVLPSEVTVVGDSAGGGLAAALLLSLRNSRRPLPALAVLISPWADLSLSGDSYRTRAHLDPIERVVALRRMAQLYLGTVTPTDPLASPIFGDLQGLPPVLVQVGDHEVLLDDSMRLARQAHAAGIDVELQIWPEMWHGWQLSAPELPEAREAIERIGSYIRTRQK